MSTGRRVCTIKSVDGSAIISYCVNECDGSSGMGSRPRSYLFTGHANGSVQVRYDDLFAMFFRVFVRKKLDYYYNE